MLTEKNILTYVSAYYLLLQIPIFQKIHQTICQSIGINWKLDTSFTQYLNFLMPFLTIVAIFKAIEQQKVEGNSQAFTDNWSLGHYTSGIILQKYFNDSDKSLLIHLIWEIYEKTGRFRLLRKILPLSLRKLFELEGYEEGDSLENVVGDFYYFYLGVLTYNLYQLKSQSNS